MIPQNNKYHALHHAFAPGTLAPVAGRAPRCRGAPPRRQAHVPQATARGAAKVMAIIPGRKWLVHIKHEPWEDLPSGNDCYIADCYIAIEAMAQSK